MNFKSQTYISTILLLSVLLFSSCTLNQVTVPQAQPAEDMKETRPKEEAAGQQTVEAGQATDDFLPKDYPRDKSQELDIETQRDYFLKAVKHLEKGQYLQAEFYLNKIKDSYLILQDYIFYYLAKAQLMQQKYSLSEGYYSILIQAHPTSIWAEKANLEYADLYFLQQNYPEAEKMYQKFYDNYPESDYAAYSLFQLALCQEKNAKAEEAYQNYKAVWLNYPTNEYAEIAYFSLERLIDTHKMEPFLPAADQVFNRAEIFYQDYNYQGAIGQLNHILEQYDISRQLKANVLLKIGMCYYNLRDYALARDYLLRAYQASEGTDIGDVALYFLGRAETNLGQNEEAVSYYRKLVSQYPQSNLSDDALYRIGRIYFFDNQPDKAIENYNLVLEKYPSGDRLGEVLWELGWIYYSTGDYSQAKDIFANMASSFKSTDLEEKGLFWQAKCLQNTGQTEQAVELFKKIVAINSYSYYTFISQEILEDKDIYLHIPPIDKSASPFNPAIGEVVPQVYQPLEDNEDNNIDTPLHIKKALELLKIEMFASASAEIEAGQTEIEKDPVHLLMLSTLFYQSQDYRNSISMLSRNQKDLRFCLKSPYRDYCYYLLYPYGFRELVDKYSQAYDTDPLFVLAVMRQESRFQPDAGSYAGARGLMQIIPSTGYGIAQKLGMDSFDIDQLFEPEKSIMMGTYYLKQQLNSFGGNKFYASGAYNGGPGAMASWISRWGEKDIYEFVENIPYDETRDYVKKVMANYYVYRMLYD